MIGNTARQRGGARGQMIRFLILGGTNTLVTYALFVGLGLFISAWIAYTIAYMVGLAWTTLGSSRFVFRARFSARRVLVFTAWYLFMFGIGQLVIRLLNPNEFTELVITSLIVLAITTPLIFIGGRYIFGADQSRPNVEEEGTR